MTFPASTTLSTAGLDNGSDSPASARLNIKLAIQALNSITGEVNSPLNACVLDAAGQIPSTAVPNTVTTPSTLTLHPGSGVVKIEDYLRLQIKTKTAVLASTTAVLGDITFYADDLTGANAGLAIYDGTNWKIIGSLSSLTTLA